MGLRMIAAETEENAMSTDRIEREIVISAPVARVWAVVTEPQHVGVWFGIGEPAEIDLRPGGIMRLDHGDGGQYSTRIVKVDPPHYLSYRWASGYPGEMATGDNSTLVEFFLEPEADGTRLRVVETGFDTLRIPAEREPWAGYDSHSAGWTEKVEVLRRYVEDPPA
jgi:uncharacterized protein YndB with AHSA1/START domain